MKAKLFDRILLALLLIVTTAISLLLIVLAARVIRLDLIQGFAAQMYQGANNAIILGASGLALLIVSIRLMFAGGQKKEVQPASTLVQATELGAAFISISAIDSMVQKHCRANNRIRNVISNVRSVRDGGVTISVRLALMPDTDIPALTTELQKTLKEYVEKHSGINVREVGILVEDTSSNPRSRVD
jgi:uncharacterized alkaline shock family protein YloU